MSNVLATIMGVFGYVLAGYILKKINLVPANIEKIFSSISFNVLLPLALIVNFWLIIFPNVLVIRLVISFLGPVLSFSLFLFLLASNFIDLKLMIALYLVLELVLAIQ